MCRLLGAIFATIAATFATTQLAAVEAPGLASRFRLVGIISAADKKGNDASLAVIKDEQSGRSIMVRRGEQIPGSAGVYLSDIKRSEIELSSSGQVIIVGYAGNETKEEKKDLTSDFLSADEMESFYYERRSDQSEDGTVEVSGEFVDTPNADAMEGGTTSFVESLVREREVNQVPTDAEFDDHAGQSGAEESRVMQNDEVNTYVPEDNSGSAVETDRGVELSGKAVVILD